jgi:hypothetical protein
MRSSSRDRMLVRVCRQRLGKRRSLDECRSPLCNSEALYFHQHPAAFPGDVPPLDLRRGLSFLFGFCWLELWLCGVYVIAGAVGERGCFFAATRFGDDSRLLCGRTGGGGFAEFVVGVGGARPGFLAARYPFDLRDLVVAVVDEFGDTAAWFRFRSAGCLPSSFRRHTDRSSFLC